MISDINAKHPEAAAAFYARYPEMKSKHAAIDRARLDAHRRARLARRKLIGAGFAGYAAIFLLAACSGSAKRSWATLKRNGPTYMPAPKPATPPTRRNRGFEHGNQPTGACAYRPRNLAKQEARANDRR